MEVEPDLVGGQVLAELLESVGREISESQRHQRMSCDAVVSTYLSLMASGPGRTLPKERKRLKKFSTLESLFDRLQSAERIVAIVGAGASTSAGIPDFRSKGGIYDMIRADYGDLFDDPRLLFDESQFKLDPAPFFRVASKIISTTSTELIRPTKCHEFLAKLEQRGKLLRCYTQNLDGLETRAGMTRVVHCHGNLSSSTCTICGKKYSTSIPPKDVVPRCDNDSGVLRPDIVFFGQDLPKEYRDHVEKDVKDTDLVLIFGSSLKVFPVASLVTRFAHRVPIVLINREIVGKPHEFDIELLGDCDAVTQELERGLGWHVDKLASTTRSYEYLPPNTYVFDDDANGKRMEDVVGASSSKHRAKKHRPEEQ